MSYNYIYYKNLNNTERDYYEKGEFRIKDLPRSIWTLAINDFKDLCKNKLDALNLKLDEDKSWIRYYYSDPDDVAALRLVYGTDSYFFMLQINLDFDFDVLTYRPMFSFYYEGSPIIIDVGM